MNKKNKIKTIKVNTFSFKFHCIKLDQISGIEEICDKYCPYGDRKILDCEKIPDPRNIKNGIMSSFMDFCGELEDRNGYELILVPGSIEKYLKHVGGVKQIRIKREDGKADFVFDFKKIILPNEKSMCCSYCAYEKTCDQIMDPRFLNHNDLRFEDFCGELGGIDMPEFLNMIPVPGSIEKGFGNTKYKCKKPKS